MLKTVIAALLDGLLKFLGDRLDRGKADDAQREGGAREVENRSLKESIDDLRAADDIRAGQPGDAERFDRLRPPARRGQHDQS